MTSQPNDDGTTTNNNGTTPTPASTQLPIPTTPATDPATALSISNALNASLLESDMEHSYLAMTKSHGTLESTCSSQRSQISSLQETVAKLQGELSLSHGELAIRDKSLGVERKKREGLEVEGVGCVERMARMEVEADSLFQQISRLTNNNVSLNSQLTELKTSTTLNTTSTPTLQYEILRLQSELESLSSHSKWLESELSTRSTQNSHLRLTHADRERELTTRLDRLTAEKEEEVAELTTVRNRLEATTNRLDRAQIELREGERERADLTQEMRMEIEQERNLVRLHKENVERVEDRYNDAVREIESMKRLAQVAIEEHEGDLERVREDVEREGSRAVEECKRQVDREVEDMRERLRITMEEKAKLEDEFMSGARTTSLTTTTPRNLPAITDGEDDRRPTLTDVYTKLAESEEEARHERAERRRTELILERIQREIETSVPKRRQERREYENAVKQTGVMQERLKDALEEMGALKGSLGRVQMEERETMHECRELRLENEDLARQVQALLKRSLGGEQEQEQEQQQGGDIVTFGTAEELQNQNQTLLREHHRLTAQISELQEKLDTEAVHVRLREAEGSLKELSEERDNQATLVSSIVQQRDLYRALLAKNDAKLLTSTGTTESTALVVKDSDEKYAQVENQNTALEESVARLKAQLSTETNSKKGLEERLLRLDAHSEDLVDSIKTQRQELSAAQASTARSQAELDYTRQVVGRLEESLEAKTKEVERLGGNKRDLQRVNEELQSALSKSRADSTKQEEDLRQTTVQSNLSQTKLLSLQAAETRLAAENNTLRSEMSRHTALHESMQKIEASISSRADEERERLCEDVKRLDALLVSERTKHEAEVESMRNRIADVDIRANALEKKGDEANDVSIAAKNDAVAAQAEVLSLKEKCKTLEEALNVATLKLGTEEDTDVSDRDRLVSMSTDLEVARADLAAAKKQAEDYRKISKANEDALADSMKTIEELKVRLTSEVETLEAERNRAQLTAQLKQEALEELTQDLNNREREQEKVIKDLKEKSDMLTTEAKTMKDNNESITSQVDSLSKEISMYKTDAASATDNYERELMLHSDARTALRSSRLETEKESRLRQNLTSQLDEVKAELLGERNAWDEQKMVLGNAEKTAFTKLEELQQQNKVLHSQLAALAETVEKHQNERSASLSEVTESMTENAEDQGGAENMSLKKQISELREIVRFMRTERETLDSQLLSARRSTERERAAAEVLNRSLDESRAELTILQGGGSDGSDGMVNRSDKLKKVQANLKQNEEQLLLMRESNQLLREESEKLSKSVSTLEKDLHDTKVVAEPSLQKCRELEVDKAALEAEKSSLAREVEAWKDRVKSLVSKFYQIDPEEHSKALAKLEESKKECAVLKAAKEQAGKETLSAKALIIGLNKDIAKHREIADSTKTALEKMTGKNADAAAARKELESVKKMKSSVDSELLRSKERVERLTGMLRSNKEIFRQTKLKLNDSVEREIKAKDNLKKEEESKKLLLKEVERIKLLQENNRETRSKDNIPRATVTDTAVLTQPPTTKDVIKSPTLSSLCERPSNDAPKESAPKDRIMDNDHKILMVPLEGFMFAPSVITSPESLSVKNKVPSTKAATENQESPIVVKMLKSDGMTADNSVEISEKEASLPLSAKLTQNVIPSSAVISPNDTDVGNSLNLSSEKANELPNASVSKEDALRQKLINRKRLLEQKLKEKGTPPISDKRPAKRERADSAITTTNTAGSGRPTQDECGPSESTTNTSVQACSDSSTTIQASMPTVNETQGLNIPPTASSVGFAASFNKGSVTAKPTGTLPKGGAVSGSTQPSFGTNVTSLQANGDSKKLPTEFPATNSGAFLNLKPPSSGQSKPLVFDKSPNTPANNSGAFLNLKPPSSGQSKPLVFGKSPNTSATNSGAFLNLKPPGSGQSQPLVFGKSPNIPATNSGAFLNLKPPSSGQLKPLVFGKSPNITLPTPSKNSNSSLESMKQQPFGAFGVQPQDGSTSFNSTALGSFPCSGNPKLSFDGVVSKKRTHQDDINEVPTTKLARVDDSDAKNGGECEEESGKAKTEIVESMKKSES